MEELRADDPAGIGPYKLTARLGAGGMGQVFLGQSASGRPVAVKVIHPEFARDPEFRARFAREVAVARKVGGYFTVPVVDADTEAAQPWLATGYVDGPSLAQAVAQHGPMPESSLLLAAAGIAEGLSAIHGAGVVHRDLKPSNVLLARDGLRVIDFGIAQAADQTSMTGTGILIGTMAYMSPEQVRGNKVGPASDVFSMGSVICYAASGKDPFRAGNAPEQMFKVAYEPPPLNVLPWQLRDLVARCMDKDPLMRPTARQFLEELAPMLPAPQSGAPHIEWWPTARETPTSPGTAPLAPVSAPPSAPALSLHPMPAPPPVRAPVDPVPDVSVITVSKPLFASPPTTSGSRPAFPVPRATASPPRRRRLLVIAASIAGVLVIVLGGGTFAIWQWGQGKYYIGADGGNVAIYHGLHMSIVGLSLSSLETDTSLPVARLSEADQNAIAMTVSYSSQAEAQMGVSQVQAQVNSCQAQWNNLVDWKSQEDAYQARLAAFNLVKAHLKPGQHRPAPPTSPGPQPATPVAANCASAAAFGIPASELPARTTGPTSAAPAPSSAATARLSSSASPSHVARPTHSAVPAYTAPTYTYAPTQAASATHPPTTPTPMESATHSPTTPTQPSTAVPTPTA
jgi:serine/threonine protein kinase